MFIPISMFFMHFMVDNSWLNCLLFFFQSIHEPLDIKVNQPSLLDFREFGIADVCFHLHVLHALHGGLFMVDSIQETFQSIREPLDIKVDQQPLLKL